MKLRIFVFWALACACACLGIAVNFANYNLTLPLDAQSMNHGIGHEYVASIKRPTWLPFDLTGDDITHPARSGLQITENGKPLGPAHAQHVDIRETGHGAYSHWGTMIQFSTTDNSDPRQNNRKYVVNGVLHLPHWLGYFLFIASGILLLASGDQPLKNLHQALRNNWVPLHHLLALLWRPTLICCALMLGSLALYASWPTSFRNEILENRVEQIIVRQQFIRSNNGVPTNVLFLGDSSCLMGIDFEVLQRSQNISTAKSLCSLGSVGPAGYGKMLLQHVASAGKPAHLVLFLHPVSFKRDLGWDEWLNIIDAMVRDEVPPQTMRHRISSTVQNGLFGRWLFHAMPGQWGTYYGTVWNFASDVRDHGSAIDPTTGLCIHCTPARIQAPIITMAQKKKTEQSAPSTETIYEINQLFIASLHQLHADIEQAGIEASHIHLAVAPIPMSEFTERFQQDRLRAIAAILNELGMQQSQLIQLPAAMDNSEFSSSTHLNRWGKEHYTLILAAAMTKMLDRQSY